MQFGYCFIVFPMINFIVVLLLCILTRNATPLKSFELSQCESSLLYELLSDNSLEHFSHEDNNVYQLTVSLSYGKKFVHSSLLRIHKDDGNKLMSIAKFCIDIHADFEQCLQIRNTIQRNHDIILDTSENSELIQNVYNLFSHQECLLSEQETELAWKNEFISTSSTCHEGWTSTTVDNYSNPYPSFHVYVVTHDETSEQALFNTLYNSGNNSNSSSDSSSSSVSLEALNSLSIVRVRSTVFFEYILYKDFLPLTYHHHSNNKRSNNQQVVSWGQLDYVGVTSYKTMRQYYSLCRHEIDRLLTITTQNNKQYDVFPLVRSKKSMLITAVLHHGTKFKQVWDAVLFSLGYNKTIVRRHDHIRPFYRNSYLIRPEWLKKLTVFMNTAIDTVLLNSTLYDIVAQPAGHYGFFNQSRAVAKRVFNSDSYQYFPFIFERLPVFYLTVEGANICHGDAVDCPFNTVR